MDLSGSPEVIAKAIGIQVTVDPELQAWEEKRDALIIRATTRC
jgi:hypothetical protein